MNFVSIWGGGFGLPETVALAAVALVGYLFGRSQKREEDEIPADAPIEVIRAAEIARQLEAIAAALRSDLAMHRAEVEHFKKTVFSASGRAGDDASWTVLRDEADRVLEPTLRLVSRVAAAYDQIRRQSSALARFSGGRTDTLTGLCNSRALSELLRIELAGHAATGGKLSIAIISVHPSKDATPESRSEQQARILQATELLRPQLRESDVLARYGIDELVVVMPHTRLYGASVFARRVRRALGDAGIAISCGLAQTVAEDTAAAMLGRADSALYSARAKGGGAQFLHNGHTIREDAGEIGSGKWEVGSGQDDGEATATIEEHVTYSTSK
ncbi:GGDEF domain-containing protein [Botrimarina mediterranea]|uniref:diguanylate cyclase n=1 Tax=Botrimarina mediterranea TaxID=2528022 RepID=A0A518KBA5_9BACT|nr:GGDEF domain-containing protein [Botrimarina mediterranea]QDV75077.1 Response regulator PleD [Botrimarina mediterranea]QDV79723.1 Response regulator PleD [Planctomycetes bacterium K2D]